MIESMDRRKFLQLGTVAAAGAAFVGLAGCTPASEKTVAAAEGGGEGGAKPDEPAPSSNADAAPSSSQAQASAASSSWRTAPAPYGDGEIAQEESADVVIVGLGPAGSAAARAAAENGASVIALEKSPEEMYMAWASEFGCVNSSLALSRGLPEIDTLDFRQEWMRRNLNRPNANIVKVYAERSGEAFDWFVEPLDDAFVQSINCFRPNGPAGTFNGWTNYLGTNIFRGSDAEHDYSFTAALKANHAVAADKGAKLQFGATAEYLETDEGGRVTAVVATLEDGTRVRYKASKGVLLAAGDFSANADMCRELLAEHTALNKGEAVGGMQQDGTGIRMGIWAGGIMDPGPVASMGGATVGEAGPLCSSPFLRLNSHAERFSNEGMLGIWGYGFQAARQPEGVITAVFDSDWADYLRTMPCDHGSVDMDNPIIAERLVADMAAVQPGPEGGQVHSGLTSDEGMMGTVYTADTLEELAGYLGYSGELVDTFVASVARYNELCDKGVDEDFAADSRCLYPVKNPPFYGTSAPKQLGGMLATVTGLMIDGQQRVLDESMAPVPGLYATGNNSGCRFAVSYSTPVGGCACGMAVTLGRYAGETIAAA